MAVVALKPGYAGPVQDTEDNVTRFAVLRRA